MFKPTTRHNIPDVKPHIKKERGGVPDRYPHRLNFYERSPSLDITLDEFETCALDRLRVLTYIESLQHRSLPAAQFNSTLTAYLKLHGPLSSNTARTVDLAAERRRDEIGHWVLRLAFSRSPELRARLVRAETALFRHRFDTDDAGERAEFLRGLKLDWIEVSSAERNEVVETKEQKYQRESENLKREKNGQKKPPVLPPVLQDRLRACVPWMRDDAFAREAWYKVSWAAVPDLVSQRRVLVRKGYAYVPQSMQISLVLQTFSDRLERALELTAKNLPRLDEDERLVPVIDHLAASFLSGIGGSEYTSSDSDAAVTAEMIDDVARKHFPPCMLSLHLRLKSERHLKHFGRLQLTLFLKGIGLPLDEALIFWRRAFGTSITDDKFAKEYRYNIRHGYGQEGGRHNYAPRSCQQILTTNQPGTQDSHGCPFRHSSPENLGNFLIANYPQVERGGQAYREIMDSVKNSHYHVACTRLFEVTHGVTKGEGLGSGESVSHPNKWVDRSREIESETIAAVNKDTKMDTT